MTYALAFCAALWLTQDEVVREKYPNGTMKEEYRVNEKKERDGPYKSWHENGQLKQTGTYDNGAKDGTWTEYAATTPRPTILRVYVKGVFSEASPLDEAGKPVAHIGAREGVVSLRAPNGKTTDPGHPRTLDEVKKKVAELMGPPWEDVTFEDPPLIEPPPPKAGKLKVAYLSTVVGRLNAYRWLSELPSDVVLDPVLTEQAQHCAVLMAVLKQVTYTPTRPQGMDKAFFDKGAAGAKNGSLVSSVNTLREALDFLMWNSSADVIGTLPQRHRCLNPAMKKTGFGEAEKMACQWSADKSGKAPVPDFVRYPGRGWVPTEFLKADAAWSLTLGPKQSPPRLGEVRVRAWLLGADYDIESELEVDSQTVFEKTIIYRPKVPADTAARVLVAILGVKGGPLLHVTELFKPPE